MLPMIILQITSVKEVAGRKPCAEQSLETEVHWQIIVRAWSKDCRSNICWDTKEWMTSNLTQTAIWPCQCCGSTPELSLALLNRLVANANYGSCQCRHSSRGLLVRDEVGSNGHVASACPFSYKVWITVGSVFSHHCLPNSYHWATQFFRKE